MAIGVNSDLKIFPDQFYSGFNEISSLNSNQFNALSRNALLLYPQASRGMYMEEAFWKNSVTVARLDLTSVSAQTPDPLSAGSFIKPKLVRKVPEIANSVQSILQSAQGRDLTESLEVFSFTLGQQSAKAVLDDYMDSAIGGLVATTTKQASTYTSLLADSTTTLTNIGLTKGLKKFGDRAGDVVAWVMHSNAFFDLLGQQTGIAADMVGGVSIYQGIAGALGRAIIVVDSPYLVKADGVTVGVDSYYTLGLRAGAAEVVESNPFMFHTEVKNGLEQIVLSFQAEFAYNLGIAGYSYTGTANNPAVSAIATSSNWTLAVDKKWSAGIVIEHS
jgi:hypothetical protein